MTYLIDVNVIYAAIWSQQPSHDKIWAWLDGKNIAVCPLVELGFIRISTHPKVGGAPMREARTGLESFLKERKATWLPDDLPALASAPKTPDEVTDSYLAELAQSHGLKLATLDGKIKHPAAVVI
jgi:toxin-antitoxin system PIN domain toxin